MSDEFDDLLAPISERRRRKERQSAPTGTSQQSGKRQRRDYAQINANIPKDLKIEIQKELLDRGGTLQGLIEELLSEWLEEQRT